METPPYLRFSGIEQRGLFAPRVHFLHQVDGLTALVNPIASPSPNQAICRL
jgi:hypothetical protein